jgi:serine protease Do
MVVLAAAVVLSGNVYAQDVLQLRGAGSQIGVTIRDGGEGVAIGDVRTGTPAERAGFKAGDLVVTFDGEAVRSARQFQRLVQETPPGKPVSTIVMRDGSRQTLTVTPETGRITDFGRQLPDRLADLRRRLPELNGDVRLRLRDPRLDRFFAGAGGRAESRLGMELTPLSDQLAGYFGVKGGALVSSVDADSLAARAGLKSGDVITAVDGQAVTAPFDLTDRLRQAGQGASVELRVTRDKKELTLKATL